MFKTFTAAALAVSISTGANADTLTTKKFLEWTPESQKGFVVTATMMAGLIATENRTEQAKCIDDWNAAHEKDGFQPVIEAMRTYPDYHPIAIVSAVIEKACGDFKYETTAVALP